MEIIATIVMLAWIPAVMLLFAVLPPHRAVIVAFLGAWLFLPVVSYPLPFLPDYTKMSATCAGVFACTLLFDPKRILRFHPHWVDLAVMLYVLCPFPSSVTNDLGVWDGVSRMMHQFVTWGLPYLIGRCFFTTTESHRELAIGMFIGGLLYIPFCLLEMRISPLCHKLLYGFVPRVAVQRRFGGWRPSVFLDSGLQLGMWMTAAALLALWMWRSGALKSLKGIPANWLVWSLFVVTVLCRAMGALVLLVVGLAVLECCKQSKNRLALVCLIAIAPMYIAVRSTGLWQGEEVVSLARVVSESRAESFKFRINNENILLEKALRQPLFGWGGWGRSRVHDDTGRDISVTDGRWIIDLGANGFVGLVAFFGMILSPPILLVRRFSARRLTSREMAPTVALAVIVTLYAVDNVPNAMANPLFMLCGGAVGAVAVGGLRATKATQASQESGVATGRFAQGVPARRPYPQPSVGTG